MLTQNLVQTCNQLIQQAPNKQVSVETIEKGITKVYTIKSSKHNDQYVLTLSFNGKFAVLHPVITAQNQDEVFNELIPILSNDDAPTSSGRRLVSVSALRPIWKSRIKKAIMLVKGQYDGMIPNIKDHFGSGGKYRNRLNWWLRNGNVSPEVHAIFCADTSDISSSEAKALIKDASLDMVLDKYQYRPLRAKKWSDIPQNIRAVVYQKLKEVIFDVTVSGFDVYQIVSLEFYLSSNLCERFQVGYDFGAPRVWEKICRRFGLRTNVLGGPPGGVNYYISDLMAVVKDDRTMAMFNNVLWVLERCLSSGKEEIPTFVNDFKHIEGLPEFSLKNAESFLRYCYSCK